MANPKLAKSKQDAIDELLHAFVIEDMAKKALFPDDEKTQKQFLTHMRKKMPQCFKTLDFFKAHYPKVMRDMKKEFEESWRDD